MYIVQCWWEGGERRGEVGLGKVLGGEPCAELRTPASVSWLSPLSKPAPKSGLEPNLLSDCQQ